MAISFTGGIATVTGMGTTTKVIGGVSETISGSTSTATIVDGNPDAMGIEIKSPMERFTIAQALKL
ncbi:MAG: hypothetical protein HZC11_02585 [Nitrospirae bacterium]|nr:hypothetical protein [Nitrospirota bacterium]